MPLNATAITGNLTVTAQTSGGYLYAGPIAMNNPTSSTLNFPVGDDRANAIVVGLTGGGALSITYVGSAAVSSTHVILDVTGYFTSALDLAGTAVIDAGDQYVEIDFSSSLPNNTQFILSPYGGPMPAGGYAVCNWGQQNMYVDICPYTAAGVDHSGWRQHDHNLAGRPGLQPLAAAPRASRVAVTGLTTPRSLPPTASRQAPGAPHTNQPRRGNPPGFG